MSTSGGALKDSPWGMLGECMQCNFGYSCLGLFSNQSKIIKYFYHDCVYSNNSAFKGLARTFR